MSRARSAAPSTFELVFYEDENGREPVLDWLRKDLTSSKRRALGLAMRHYLQVHGPNVAEMSFGRNLGDGLFEFKLDDNLTTLAKRFGLALKPTRKGDDDVLLRVFFHPYGQKLILLLGGYDKGKDPSKKRQQKEIDLARKRLRRWQRLQG